jgi:hypothetical protein
LTSPSPNSDKPIIYFEKMNSENSNVELSIGSMKKFKFQIYYSKHLNEDKKIYLESSNKELKNFIKNINNFIKNNKKNYLTISQILTFACEEYKNNNQKKVIHKKENFDNENEETQKLKDIYLKTWYQISIFNK